MLPTESREILLLVWSLAGDRAAAPEQVPIGTPLGQARRSVLPAAGA
jgi:hypothetical protein